MKSISYKADVWARLQDGASEAAVNKIHKTGTGSLSLLWLSLSHTHTRARFTGYTVRTKYEKKSIALISFAKILKLV